MEFLVDTRVDIQKHLTWQSKPYQKTTALDVSIKVNGKTNMKWVIQAHAQYVAEGQKIIMKLFVGRKDKK